MQINRGGPGLMGLQSEMNVTPLVDVVLVLLIIFMVVVPLLLQGYDVDVPKMAAAAAPQADEQIILSIGPAACPIVDPPAGEGLPADCRVSLGDSEIPAQELPARVASLLGRRPADRRVLFLAADDGLNYEGVLRVVDLARSGVDELQIEVVTVN